MSNYDNLTDTELLAKLNEHGIALTSPITTEQLLDLLLSLDLFKEMSK